MEKATIKKSGAGWSLDFHNGKNPTTCNWTHIPKDWDNSEILVERVQGQPTKLQKGDSVINKQSVQQPSQPDNGSQDWINRRPNTNREIPQGGNYNNDIPTRLAKSPYNFVPLNKTVVYPISQDALFNKYEVDKNSGTIKLKIENLTDLMISKGASSDLPDREHDFLKIGPNNLPIIPGSSLRGLIKKLVGIVSYSKLIEGEHFGDHALFYRGVADKAFTNIYQQLFFDTTNHFDYKPKSGYLAKKGNNYVIYPAQADANNNQYYKIRNTGYLVTIDPGSKKPVFKFGGQRITNYLFRDIYFQPSIKTLHTHSRFDPRMRRNVDYELNYALVTIFSFTQNPTNPLTMGKLVISGGMGRKKHDQWVVNQKTNNFLIIQPQLIKDYKDDTQRNKEFNLLEQLNNHQEVPCFYLTDQTGSITSFGHTPLYRIKHLKTIKDAIHQNIDAEKLDFEQLIFGDTEHFTSRVYFEDAVMEPKPNAQMGRTLIKIQSGPKPTSHQFYLEQNSMPLRTWSYQENIEIAGTKEYWNKNVNSDYWRDPEGNVTDSHAGYIKPIRVNNIFEGRIRFENLTNEELGALLFALDLPEGCCHKIGMGKPHGLGSVKISSVLKLDDRKIRYSELLTKEGKWNLPEKLGVTDFKKSFSDFVLPLINKDMRIEDLWGVERLSQLKAMLVFDEELFSTQEWLNETRYLEIERESDENGDLYRDRNGNAKPFNEFSKRETLDTPKHILTRFKNRQ